MQLYPAIYIKNKQCVQLKQGLADKVNAYCDDPVAMAQYWMHQGAQALHLINLDGTSTEHFTSSDVFRRIAYAIPIPLHVCGGIRTLQDIEFVFNCGIQRAVMGTIAVQNPRLIKEAVTIFGADKLMITVHIHDARVITNSWRKSSDYTPLDFCMKMQDLGIQNIIIKDVGRENTLSGLDLTSAIEVVERTHLKVFASGGTASLKDLENASYANVDGVIVGKALYEKKIDLKEAIRLFQ